MDLKKTNTQMESVGENDDDNERIHDSYFEIRKQLQKIWLNLFLAGMLSCSQDDGNQPWTEVRGENLIKEIYTRRNKKQLKHTANEFSIETLITNHVQRQGVTRVLDTPKTLGEKRALSFDDFALATSYPVSFISKPFLSRSTISAYKKFGGSFFSELSYLDKRFYSRWPKSNKIL
jgi:hypothetical protein